MNSVSTTISSQPSNTPSIQKYEVLYYKRTNKVHKQKGVSRLDGILTIHLPPSNLVTLTANDDEEDISSDEEESSKKFKKKNLKQKKQILYSSRNMDIVNSLLAKGSFSDDDVIVLPSWEVQIVSNLSGVKETVKTHGKATLNPLMKKTNLLQRSGGNLIGKKRPLVSTATQKLTNPLKKSGPLQSRTRPLHAKRTMSCVATRKPPAQPKRNDSSTDSDCEQEKKMESRSVLSSSLLMKKKNPLLSRPKTKFVPLKPLNSLSRSSSSLGQKKKCVTNDSSFPGTIGNLYVPSAIKSILRPHQQTGLVFLWNCLTGACPRLQKIWSQRYTGIDDEEMESIPRPGAGCILADEMGLGKTLQTIAVITALHRRNRNDRFIVVCPSSLVMNWSKEFDKFLGKASNPKRVVIRKGGEEGLQRLKSFVPEKHQNAEVLIVSYDLFRIHSELLAQSQNVGLLVVDEGHRLKNTAGTKVLSALNMLNCKARLLISGTPIQNNLSEYYNVANFVLPGILGDLNSFRKQFERPISAASKKNASSYQKEEGRLASKELEKITSTFMIRRLQSDVLKTLLPPRNETLLFCRPSQEQKKLYKKLTKTAFSDCLSTLTNLRKLCSHPSLLETSSEEEPDYSCTRSGKLDILDRLLRSIRRESPDDKVVIVSNFTSALSVIEEGVIKRRGWNSLRLDGTTEQSTRQALVDSFNRSSTNDSFVFLLSSKAGGVGLNLVGANRLVMFDLDWNPSTDAQAMARVYRQGQKKECFIYRLMLTGTVEEVIYQRQVQKGLLDSKNRKSNNSGFTDDELKDCFTLKENCDCDTKRKMGNKWDEYDGETSLLEKGVQDKPLLNLAAENNEILSFVHFVDEEVDEDSPINNESNVENVVDDASEDADDWDCFDEESDEEAEFEG